MGLTGISLFSGIGGAAYGMQQAGINLIQAVEFDSANIAYSEDCRQMHAVNFPGSKFIMERVEKVASDLPRCDILQASPVCKSFSVAGKLQGNKELGSDEEMARAVCKAIAASRPTWFFLEQVPGYQGTKSLGLIIKHLYTSGYSIRSKVVDVADYGVPQNRKRFFLLASIGVKPWDFPSKRRKMGWCEAIAGIALTEKAVLTERQCLSLEGNISKYKTPRGVMIQRIAISHKSLLVRSCTEPCWTITRSVFTDGHGGARKATINVVNDSGAFNLPMRAIARLGGFPDSFHLGRYAGEGIGYSVPPKFARQLIEAISL